jgi:hypothetical protein
MSSKPPAWINYPNNITDHHTVLKLREMIDHANALKQSLVANQEATAKNAADLASLPLPITMTDVTIAINAALKKAGVTTTVGTPTAMAAARSAEIRILVTGPRAAAPRNLARDDAGFMYYVTDYARLVFWDGYAYQISDPGGWFVDSSIDPGPGFALCDGSTTDYMLNDTPDLEVMPFTTPRHRFRRYRRYFRR